jgi:hypothetical protein
VDATLKADPPMTESALGECCGEVTDPGAMCQTDAQIAARQQEPNNFSVACIMARENSLQSQNNASQNVLTSTKLLARSDPFRADVEVERIKHGVSDGNTIMCVIMNLRTLTLTRQYKHRTPRWCFRSKRCPTSSHYLKDQSMMFSS